jgi:hypothetical protein
MRILWQQVAKTISTEPELMEWAELHAHPDDVGENFQELSKFDPLNKHRLLLMNPVMMATLLNTEDLPKIAQNYHLFEDLVMIRRSVASDLTLNENRDLISLRTMMPNCEIKTITLAHRQEEETEAQWCHLVHAR